MLSSDLVRARRRGETLHLQKLKGAEMAQAVELAQNLLDVAHEALSTTAEEVHEALGLVSRESRHEKLWAGLKKLLLDACEFESGLDIDAPVLRRELFELASLTRSKLSEGGAFDRDAALSTVAKRFSLEAEALDAGMFGDLKGAQKLVRVPRFSAVELIAAYELAQIQGVLLKAVRLTVLVNCHSPDAYRRLFQKLKFRRLLYRLTEIAGDGYRIEIDGPFSLFESVTKYGLQLALIVPALIDCKSVELEAELRWGKERKTLLFQTKFKDLAKQDGATSVLETEDALRSEVQTLLSSLQKKKSGWEVKASSELLDIPGVGLCVPDLVFSAKGRKPVYLEILGFWSRDAVWRRVEWAQSGTGKRVVFAVSSRLRVSQEVLEQDSGSSLYVFKGTMSAPAVLAQVEALAALP